MEEARNEEYKKADTYKGLSKILYSMAEKYDLRQKP